MSEIALAWAKAKITKSIAQRDVLLAMAGVADEVGTVGAPLRALTPQCGGLTREQVVRYADGLITAGWATKSWDADKYSWVYRLKVVAV